MPKETVLDERGRRDWCGQYLGAVPVGVLFQAGYSAQVVGVELNDGRQVVIKARPWEERLVACGVVQRAVFEAGYPAPEPLAGPIRDGTSAVSAERYVAGGAQRSLEGEAATAFAAGLAKLVRLAPAPDSVGSLRPSPPWVGWDRPGPDLWPPPDDRPGDLNSHRRGDWLDQLAARVKARLAAHLAPVVVGHGDWHSQNLHWREGDLLAVHDWDSVVAQPEAAIAGSAAAVWPGTGNPGEVPTIDQTDAFLAGYADSRGRPWTRDETEACWAAGLWTRAFNAKKASFSGENPELDLTPAEAKIRYRNAGL